MLLCDCFAVFFDFLRGFSFFSLPEVVLVALVVVVVVVVAFDCEAKIFSG